MRCTSRPFLALAVILLAPSAGGLTLHTNLSFLVNEIPDSVEGGFEPHVIAGPGPDGTGEVLYIDSPNGLASQLSGNLWRSDDGGDTWESKPKDFGNIGGSGDSYTAIASDGTLYFTDLYGATVTIDVTTDGGDSWFQNPYGGSRFGDDRQWFVMGPTINGLPGMRDQTLYLIYNSIDGLILDRFRYDRYAVVKETTLSITTNTYARDYLAVDQNDGTLYLPNYEGDSVALYRSSDAGVTWDTLTVATGTGNVQNIFIVADVDAMGNLYLAWCDQRNVTLAVSTDRGESWAIHSVTDTPGTRVLPWVTAGDGGMIGLNWYETKDVGDCNDLDSNWSVYAAVCVNATAPDPEFLVTPVLEDMHVGSIATQGFGATSDRDLGDFFTCDVDSYGRLILVTGRDDDDGVNARLARVVFLRQREGPFLLDGVGPEAHFSVRLDELKAHFDGNDSFVRDGLGIVDWSWDFGDGSNGSGQEVAHAYRRAGTYDVTLTVTDEADRISRETIQVTVSETDENPPNMLPVLAAVIVAVVIVVALHRKGVLKGLTGRVRAKKSAAGPPSGTQAGTGAADGGPQRPVGGVVVTAEDEVQGGVQQGAPGQPPPPGGT